MHYESSCFRSSSKFFFQNRNRISAFFIKNFTCDIQVTPCYVNTHWNIFVHVTMHIYICLHVSSLFTFAIQSSKLVVWNSQCRSLAWFKNHLFSSFKKTFCMFWYCFNYLRPTGGWVAALLGKCSTETGHTAVTWQIWLARYGEWK